MNVRELISKLQEVEDKEIDIYYGIDDGFFVICHEINVISQNQSGSYNPIIVLSSLLRRK